eukprot:TRINITY_DN20314_c0_g1_i1.p1 TRINITY_DN20314_c0_g1~~TRINITY_DN20314_c0_g1_i1.p1  ORF type:complete len:339 (+),score=66.17 TRINITY_DN20314_c0_g1_i1:130-1146(+)
MLRIVKPKTQRARRALEKRAPKLHENTKKAVFLHGTKTSAVMRGVISDLYHLKKPGGNAVKFTKKNDNVRPFEGGGEAPLEFISQKSDCSLFLFASHSKKRPNNMVLGRTFDGHMYDMIELGVEDFKPISSFGGGGKHAPQEGSKPCFAFIGHDWETNEQLRQLKDILLDFFRGDEVKGLDLVGLDRAFICIACPGKVWLRHCALRQTKSGSVTPKIDLIETGPSLNLSVRRNRLPGQDLRKEAMRSIPVETKKKIKNVSTDSMLGKVGRIYMPKQEVDSIALQKMKGLKRERREAARARSEGSNGKEAEKVVATKEDKAQTGGKPPSKRQRELPADE